MRKLTEVEEATAVMTEAVNWSVMKWLREKKRVRRMADRANDALDELDRAVKATWSKEVEEAYRQLAASKAGANAEDVNPEIRQFVKKVKQADDEAYRAHMDAEDTFDEAERQLSTRLAREGCHKAILSWELREKAIAKAQDGAGRR